MKCPFLLFALLAASGYVAASPANSSMAKTRSSTACVILED